MSAKITTALTSITGIAGIEVAHNIPLDPSFYTELFKILLQIVIAIITLIKLLKSKKSGNNS